MVKNPPANVGDTGDTGLIPGSGRSPEVGNGNPLSILAWKILWTEEPGGPQSMGVSKRRTRLNMYTLYTLYFAKGNLQRY